MVSLAKRIDSALNTSFHRWDIYQLPPQFSIATFLQKRITLPEHTQWQDIASFAGVYVNGRECGLDDTLPSPCRLELYVPRHSVESCISDYNAFIPETDIVCDRQGIVVAYKPPRLHTMPAREQKVYSLKRALEDHFHTDIHMPSRLDFSTQGLVLTSRSSVTHNFAQGLYQQRRVKKGYLFATAKMPDFERRTLSAAIGQDPRHAVLRKVVSKGGKKAVTHFHYLGSHPDNKHVVLAIPETGRTHQIRVHAAHLGLPLLGDKFYAGQEANHLHLICACLIFPLPDSDAPIRRCIG
jgi:23S rRNA-/tRNA-specific pseudouridylate synthase